MFVTLMYHVVSDARRDPMVVSRAAFGAQLSVLEALGARPLRLEEASAILDGAPSPTRSVLLSFDDGYRNAVTTVLPMLRAHGAPALLSLCSTYLDPRTRPRTSVHVSNDFASPRDIERWLGAGHGIAGHTLTHPKLTELGEDEIEAEVALDHQSLEQTFGRALDTFVYPFGAFDAKVEAIVGRHYRNAFSDGSGSWPSPHRRLAIRRTQVRPEWSLEDFRRRLELELEECRRPPSAAPVAAGLAS